MAVFDDIFKSTQWHQSIQKSLGLSSQLSEMFKTQERITKSLSGINMATELAKSMQQHHRIFENPTLSAIEAMTKSLSLQTKFAIPQSTLDAITSINRQHEQLFGGLRAMTEALKIQSPAIAQINNLNFALSGISGQIAAIAAQQRNWTIIDDFEEVSEQAIEFSESLTEEITEEQQRQFQILLTLVTTFVKKYGVQGLLIIDIILRFAGFHQYYDFLKQKPELPTKLEVNQIAIKQDSIIQFISAVNEQLKIAKEYRTTNRECDVKLKPKTKTLIVSKLSKDFELVVLQVNHKWALVSYFDPKDNLPQTGWIMKKYLDKPD
ncbi:hypothetical protein OX284_011615 [Flavobacterium sp. SUN046]|nr:hypothetical protein [Flavobacterium sp. SUN046]